MQKESLRKDSCHSWRESISDMCVQREDCGLIAQKQERVLDVYPFICIHKLGVQKM